MPPPLHGHIFELRRRLAVDSLEEKHAHVAETVLLAHSPFYRGAVHGGGRIRSKYRDGMQYYEGLHAWLSICCSACRKPFTFPFPLLPRFQGGTDPKLGKDEEYPEWLWTLTDPRPVLSELEKKGVETLELAEASPQQRAPFR